MIEYLLIGFANPIEWRNVSIVSISAAVKLLAIVFTSLASIHHIIQGPLLNRSHKLTAAGKRVVIIILVGMMVSAASQVAEDRSKKEEADLGNRKLKSLADSLQSILSANQYLAADLRKEIELQKSVASNTARLLRPIGNLEFYVDMPSAANSPLLGSEIQGFQLPNIEFEEMHDISSWFLIRAGLLSDFEGYAAHSSYMVSDTVFHIPYMILSIEKKDGAQKHLLIFTVPYGVRTSQHLNSDISLTARFYVFKGDLYRSDDYFKSLLDLNGSTILATFIHAPLPGKQLLLPTSTRLGVLWKDNYEHEYTIGKKYFRSRGIAHTSCISPNISNLTIERFECHVPNRFFQ